MGLNGTTFEKKQRPIPPQGPQVAVCYSIIDCGTHMKSYQGQEPKATPIVQFSWEFPNLPHQIFDPEKGPQPLAIFQEYTTALGDKAKLQKMLTSWRSGKVPMNLSIELPQFLGQPCFINVEYNRDKQKPEIIYANIGTKGLGIMPIPQGTPVGPLTNPKVFFNLDNYSHDQFIKLPVWIQKKIQSSMEWSGIVAKFGAPPQPVQNNQQGQNNNFQQQGRQFNGQQTGFQQQPFNTAPQTQNAFQQQPPVQNTGFQTNYTVPATNQQPVQTNGFSQPQTNQPPAQQNGVGFGGEIITTNPFETNKPPF